MALLLPRREKLDLALTFDFNLVVWLFGSYFTEDSFDAHAHASASGAQFSPGLKVVVLWEVKEAGRGASCFYRASPLGRAATRIIIHDGPLCIWQQKRATSGTSKL